MISNTDVPHFIKYMGSKREILDYIHCAIKSLNVESTWFCDLFAGTSSVAGSFKHEYNVHVNDIQSYSSIFAHTYFYNLHSIINDGTLKEIENKVWKYVDEFDRKYPEITYKYSQINDFEIFQNIEEEQKKYIDKKFIIEFSLFTKYYSGTYWSSTQCKWIDSIRATAEEYAGTPMYYAILSCLMFAMSYASQSTGHFAQYRKITRCNMNNILQYRNKDIWRLFSKKFEEIAKVINSQSIYQNRITTLDYVDCLKIIEKDSIVYADPPYTSVHYSRFYHALETLVRYDHPVIKFTGRYRDDRHQSPFDKGTEVRKAFRKLFEGVKERNSHLILSYSDNGMISQEEIENISSSILGKQYETMVTYKEHIHSKMGRSDIHEIGVNELIISYKRKN